MSDTKTYDAYVELQRLVESWIEQQGQLRKAQHAAEEATETCGEGSKSLRITQTRIQNHLRNHFSWKSAMCVVGQRIVYLPSPADTADDSKWTGQITRTIQ